MKPVVLWGQLAVTLVKYSYLSRVTQDEAAFGRKEIRKYLPLKYHPVSPLSESNEWDLVPKPDTSLEIGLYTSMSAS